MLIEFKITGLSEVQETLERAPLRASRRIIRTGLVAAGFLWQQEMETRARRGWHHERGKGGKKQFGLLAKSILLKAKVTSDLTGEVDVGPSQKSFWSLFLEFGRHAGRSRRGRNYPAMPPYPFVRTSYEARKTDVLEEFVIETKAALEREGLKLR